MVCVRACIMSVEAQRASIHQPEACFPGDTQLRVRGGWQRDGRVAGGGESGVACRTGDGQGMRVGRGGRRGGFEGVK